MISPDGQTVLPKGQKVAGVTEAVEKGLRGLLLPKGQKVAGVTEAVEKGLHGLLSLDPFHDIDPMSFTPNAEDKTFQNDHEEEDGEIIK